MKPHAERRAGVSLVETLVTVCILGLLLAILMPAIGKARQSSQAAFCRNNMRQLGVALHHHESSLRILPIGCSFSGPNELQPHLSWLARLLPYLEYDVLWHQTLDAFAKEKWFGSNPPHVGLATPIRGFTCPSTPGADQVVKFPSLSVAFTSYLGVSGTNQNAHDGFLFLNSKTSLTNCPDGVSNTILSGERPQSAENDFGWWYAGWGQNQDGSVEMIMGVRELSVFPVFKSCGKDSNWFRPGVSGNQCDALHYWSYHPGGANFLLADGAVVCLRYSANSVLPALATRNGAESVAIPE